MAETNRQARAEATRLHLLQSARLVFAERGYGATTVAAITDRAETAHGTFYLYFRNKEDLFVHVISEVVEELYEESFAPAEELGADFDPVVLRKRIVGFLTVMAAHGPLWRALFEGALASPVVEQHWMAQRHRFHDATAERWHLLQEQGIADPSFDIEVASNALSSMLEWFAFSRTVFNDPEPLRVDDRVVDTLVTLWMSAVSGAI